MGPWYATSLPLVMNPAGPPARMLWMPLTLLTRQCGRDVPLIAGMKRQRTAMPAMQQEARESRDARILRRLDAWLLMIERLLNAASGWLILALMGLLVAVVVGRALFDQPLRGQVDFVKMAVPSFAFLGLSYCYRMAGHVRMDIVLRTVPDRPRIAAELIGALVAVGIAVVLVIGTGRDTWRAWRFGDTTMDVQLLTWPARSVICFGLTVFALRAALTAWSWMRALADPRAAPIGVPEAPPQEEPGEWIEPAPSGRASG